MDGAGISALGLARFRSHARLTLALDGRPVAIWGPNGAGKTNILEAVSLLSPGRGLRRAAPADLAQRPAGAGWAITARVNAGSGAADAHEVQTGSDGLAPRSVSIDDKLRPQSALAGLLPILWLVPAMDRLFTEPAEGRRRFLDRVTLSFLPGHADVALTYEKAMRERNRLLKDGAADPHWYAALEEEMARAGATLAENRRRALAMIVTAQQAEVAGFPAADLTLTGPEGEPAAGGAAADLLAAWREGRRRDMAAGRTLAGPHRADLSAVWRAKGMPAAQASTGEQKALLISIVLANARALSGEHGRRPVLLLDEVAAHLDADRRAALYDVLVTLGAQAFMTGTGPELFAPLSGRAQGFVVHEAQGVSQVTEGAIA